MTARPWKTISPVTLRAAIVTEGTRPKVVRFVVLNVMAERYSVHIARRGQLGRKLATGTGTPDEAVRHGCADYQFLNMRGVWNRPPKIPLDGGTAQGL